jgi:hypothetical protein
MDLMEPFNHTSPLSVAWMTLRILIQVYSWADSHLTTLLRRTLSNQPFLLHDLLHSRFDMTECRPLPWTIFHPHRYPNGPETSHIRNFRTLRPAEHGFGQRVTVHVQFAIALDLVDDRRGEVSEFEDRENETALAVYGRSVVEVRHDRKWNLEGRGFDSQ